MFSIAFRSLVLPPLDVHLIVSRRSQSKQLKPRITRRRPSEEAKSQICLTPAGDITRGFSKALHPHRRLVTLLGWPVTVAAATEEVKASRALVNGGMAMAWFYSHNEVAGTVRRDAMERFECIARVGSALQGVV